MISVNMSFEPFSCFFELNKFDFLEKNQKNRIFYAITVQTTNETDVFHISINTIFLISQFCEGVNNNTENNIQENNVDH